MEQRRVRLGDIVDDYCTRERRVTNHAVVAMIEDQIQLTRCTTCDTEHPYKAAKVPRKRKKTETGALYEQVLSGRERETLADADGPSDGRLAGAAPGDDGGAEAGGGDEAVAAGAEMDAGEQPEAPLEDGPVRRPLIRATLPRPEGQQTVRPLPEFTIRQPGARGGFRGDARGNGRSGGRPSNNGGRSGFQGQARSQGGRSGFGHGRQGAAQGQGGPRQDRHSGPRHHQPAPQGRSGKKRSR